VIYDASSLAKNAANEATSSGSPYRRKGLVEQHAYVLLQKKLI